MEVGQRGGSAPAFLKGALVGILFGIPFSSIALDLSAELFGIFEQNPQSPPVSVEANPMGPESLLIAFLLCGAAGLAIRFFAGNSGSIKLSIVVGSSIGILCANVGMGMLRFKYNLLTTKGSGCEGIDVLRVNPTWIFFGALATGIAIGSAMGLFVCDTRRTEGLPTRCRAGWVSVSCVSASWLIYFLCWKLTPLFKQISA